MSHLRSSVCANTDITENAMDHVKNPTAPNQVPAQHVIITVSALFALFMNLFSFINLLCKKKLRTNRYLRAVLCLSVGYMIASVCVLHKFVRRFFTNNDVSDMECLVNFVTLCSSLQQTNLQMLLLAAERYLASRGNSSSQHFCRFNVQAAYMVFSLVVCVAYNVTNSIYHKMNGTFLCQSGQFVFFEDSSVGLALCLPIMVSIIVLIFLYSFTIRNIHKSSARVGHFHRRTSNVTQQGNRYGTWVVKGLVWVSLVSNKTSVILVHPEILYPPS